MGVYWPVSLDAGVLSLVGVLLENRWIQIEEFLMKRMIAVYTLLCSAILLAGCIAVRNPNVVGIKRMDTPPYTTIRNGEKFESKSLPEKLPLLEKGQVVAFYTLGDGTMGQLTCEKVSILDVVAPVARKDCQTKTGNGRVDTEQASLETFQTSAKGTYRIVVGKTILEEVSDSSMLAMKTHQQKSVSVSSRGEDRMKVRRQESKTVSAESKVETEMLATQVAESQLQGGSEIAQGQGVFVTRGAKGHIDSLDGEEVVSMMIGENVVNGLYDANWVRILVDDEWKLPGDEADAMREMLQRRESLEKILNRAVFSELRKDVDRTVEGAEAQLLVEEVTGEFFSFGGYYKLNIKVMNTGKAALFDMVILNEVPANASFNRFAVAASEASGYYPFFIDGPEERRLIAVRIYKPIEPGENRVISVILRADPWDFLAEDRATERKTQHSSQ